jgi:hypothetical protein
MRRTSPLIPLLLTSLLCLPLVARAGQVVSRGTFTDKEGKAHEWSVNAAHTLIWDDKPFVPVGGKFQARSWSARATDADFDADVEALKLLKESRVTDIYLQPARGGLGSVPPARVQRLIDYLDKEGFTYGVSINDGPSEVLTGYDVRPGKYWNTVPKDGGIIRFPIDTLIGALYFIVQSNGQDVLRAGEAAMVAEGARVTVEPIPGNFDIFLVPRKANFTLAAVGIPNLWDGFDAYRDALLVQLRQVKFGKGFRFFVDPLPADMDYTSAFSAFLPVGPGFQTEFADWLARKYKSLDALQTRWQLRERPLKTFNEAAGMVPLWGAGKGVDFLYNPESGLANRVTATYSEYWRDLNEFKTRSVRDYMSDLAVVLKKHVANVPVVYRTDGYSPLFAGLPANRGFDGVGIAAYGRGSDLVTRHAGYAYAQASEAPKTLWLPVVATADAAPTVKNSPGYASRTVLHQDLDNLRQIGARGFYVDSVRGADPARKFYDLSAQPEQLKWVADYADVLSAAGVGDLDRVPAAFYYPRAVGIETASVRPLTGGGWWLPSDRPGIPYDFGPSGKAYALSEPDGGVTYYLWNPAGRRTIRLKMPKASTAPDARGVVWSPNANGVIKKDVLTLTIGPDPIRLENYPIIPVPLDAFAELAKETEGLIALLKKQSSMDAGRLDLNLGSLRAQYNADNPILSITELQALRGQARDRLRPYAWQEAENMAHTFDAVAVRYGASGSRVLMVDPRLPGAPAAAATFTITARAPGAYNIWVACSPDPSLSFRINGRPLLDEAISPQKVGASFADGALVWYKFGIATLPAGTHTIEIRASSTVLLDAVLIIQGDFIPNGAMQPPVVP